MTISKYTISNIQACRHCTPKEYRNSIKDTVTSVRAKLLRKLAGTNLPNYVPEENHIKLV